MHLVLGGGACTGVCYYSALLDSLGWDRFDIPFETITVYSASSVSLSLYLLGIPMSAASIHQFWTAIYQSINPISVLEGAQRSLLQREVVVTAALEAFPGLSSEWTLLDLFILTGVRVQYGVSAIVDSGMQGTVLNHETHPHLSVVDAMLSSCCVPLLFEPVYVAPHGALYDGELTCEVIGDVYVKLTDRGYPATGHAFVDQMLTVILALALQNTRRITRLARAAQASIVIAPITSIFDVTIDDCERAFEVGRLSVEAFDAAVETSRSRQAEAAEKKCKTV